MIAETQKRELITLTDDESRTLFAVAFGYAPPVETIASCGLFRTFAITDGIRSLFLSPDGSIAAYDKEGGSLTFNARKVLTNIDAMGLGFGPGYGPELFMTR
ncbi:hypothetical protein [Spirosoma oryzicola]|uniref:hypothetical protein n=1 Tax=Spirosoma oryzicola TaxID=2898794 RepID=UPI001E64B718|nr:hypothetical protein [Spirosoma oryzicola]UHG93353.1 hypothetical protein LQ777_10715 [Spirosoma oryzicola]